MGGGQMMVDAAANGRPGYGLVVFAMWAVMMVAMMLPSAAPVTLLIAGIARKRARRRAPRGCRRRCSSPAISRCGSPSPPSRPCCNGGSRGWECCRRRWRWPAWSPPPRCLIAAGIYQWTPLKQACLRHCRSPLEFLLFHWRDGAARRVHQRRAARRVLLRLLLDADGAAVRRRRDEPRLDRRDRALGADREGAAVGRLDGTGDRRGDDRLGCRHARRASGDPCRRKAKRFRRTW